ncbi:catalase [Marinimicrobium sp. C2-29]|uniref:catalase n=1 Tax=Marinimicrobium sp. C2-29 TaxID=3139825 RepID=UPI003138BD0E
MKNRKVTPDTQAEDTNALVEKITYNANKALEHGHDNALSPPQGVTAEPPTTAATASTINETNASDKTGGAADPGNNATIGTLDRVRSDPSGQRMTTNQGVPVADNQNSLKAGLRGPALLEDFILREKITHFDHERIPERIVHARGSAAHGFFEAYEDLSELTRAAPFSEKGKVTPVFTRFSTVAGERGSVDTARDIRGFAVKFYTDEGNWDLVGNNIPVFFIQDAMKFPDLVHAVKPEPHHGMPQAGSAHNTFWDFVSLMPESTHTLMWTMSDRGIPRSYRMMQGFGVHTFRLVNAQGSSHFVKFHWTPKLGTHSLVWEEATKIQGADNDFHRRDLWDAIEAGEYPEWELGLQIFTEEEADAFSFDVLDATKIVPEELVPVRPVGRMVLNRNPDNFFAETEQVAFCTAHVVPGIDFTNDPLLAGRIHSYVDTQISRLGGPNFHEIPINSPIAPVHNNQRDGMHRQAVHRGPVAYEPNSLGGGCPFQTGEMGFMSFPERISDDKVRGKPEKFADHYTQATLFWESQTEWEKEHLVGGFRFELSKVTVPAIRERMLSSLVNVSKELATEVAKGLGLAVPKAMPKALSKKVKPEVTRSPALSLTARPGDGGIRTRKVAILLADGIDGGAITRLKTLLTESGAIPVLLGPQLGTVTLGKGSAKAPGKKEPLEAKATLENSPDVLFDGLILPDGDTGVAALAAQKQTNEFIVNQYNHGKTILAMGASSQLLDAAGVESSADGVFLAESKEVDAIGAEFIAALGQHRHPLRRGA